MSSKTGNIVVRFKKLRFSSTYLCFWLCHSLDSKLSCRIFASNTSDNWLMIRKTIKNAVVARNLNALTRSFILPFLCEHRSDKKLRALLCCKREWQNNNTVEKVQQMQTLWFTLAPTTYSILVGIIQCIFILVFVSLFCLP